MPGRCQGKVGNFKRLSLQTTVSVKSHSSNSATREERHAAELAAITNRIMSEVKQYNKKEWEAMGKKIEKQLESQNEKFEKSVDTGRKYAPLTLAKKIEEMVKQMFQDTDEFGTDIVLDMVKVYYPITTMTETYKSKQRQATTIVSTLERTITRPTMPQKAEIIFEEEANMALELNQLNQEMEQGKYTLGQFDRFKDMIRRNTEKQ